MISDNMIRLKENKSSVIIYSTSCGLNGSQMTFWWLLHLPKTKPWCFTERLSCSILLNNRLVLKCKEQKKKKEKLWWNGSIHLVLCNPFGIPSILNNFTSHDWFIICNVGCSKALRWRHKTVEVEVVDGRGQENGLRNWGVGGLLPAFCFSLAGWWCSPSVKVFELSDSVCFFSKEIAHPVLISSGFSWGFSICTCSC